MATINEAVKIIVAAKPNEFYEATKSDVLCYLLLDPASMTHWQWKGGELVLTEIGENEYQAWDRQLAIDKFNSLPTQIKQLTQKSVLTRMKKSVLGLKRIDAMLSEDVENVGIEDIPGSSLAEVVPADVTDEWNAIIVKMFSPEKAEQVQDSDVSRPEQTAAAPQTDFEEEYDEKFDQEMDRVYAEQSEMIDDDTSQE